jgi:DNA-binding response OmpR family regulator
VNQVPTHANLASLWPSSDFTRSRSIVADERLSDMYGRKILVIDDDADLRQIVTSAFSVTGAQVYTAAGGPEGLRQFYAHQPDLVILDLMMPDMDGWEVCRQIRRLSDVPLIMLTALSQEERVIEGFTCGADDYVIKPFNPEILLVRAEAVLRRSTSPSQCQETGTYRDDYLTIDLDQHRVLVNGAPVKLTPTEYRLLAYLLTNAGRVLTFRQILQNVWGEDYQDSVEYVHVHLSNLRQKLEPDPKRPRYLQSEYGLGYRFEN